MTSLQQKLLVVGGAVAALSWLLSASLFIVYPWQSTLILQFGELIDVKRAPGLYLKMPWQDARYFDSRILTVDKAEPDRYITEQKENLLVDSYIKWRIIAPRKYYETTLGRERDATQRLSQIVNSALRDEIGKRAVKDVVTRERQKIMTAVRERANKEVESFGIEISDVRVKRVDLPLAVSENVYKNMIEERRRIANERRSGGEAEKEKIEAEADRKRTVLLAEANRAAERLRGEGDAQAAAIYTDAYSQHREFYDFHRSLRAYRLALGGDKDIFLLSPSSDFFRYIQDEAGGKPAPTEATQ